MSLKNKLIPEIEKVIEKSLSSEYQSDLYDLDDEKRKKIKIAVAEVLRSIAWQYDKGNNRLTL